MAENRFPCASGPSRDRETVCIETNRVLDSCRDRDCFENVRVYLSCYGKEVLERTGAIRAKCAKIVWTYIGIDPIRFNRGFYSVTIRFYVKITFEACVGGGRSQELDGVAVLEKRVILYGGESNVNIFKSHGCQNDFCSLPQPVCEEHNVPTAIVEIVDPVLLSTKIVERVSECNCCCCCCQENDLPEAVLNTMDAPLSFDDDGETGRYLTVSLGIFSIVRIVRPAQYLIQATEYCIPEKECTPVEEDDPCRVFRSMPFPVGEFGVGCAPTPPPFEKSPRCGCGS
ncbi:MAG: hypothetical protein E7666_08425 [Ruminococcaceae bacterium]|nr:hypothetical protein [Oscillospiraceae bacterium]